MSTANSQLLLMYLCAIQQPHIPQDETEDMILRGNKTGFQPLGKICDISYLGRI